MKRVFALALSVALASASWPAGSWAAGGHNAGRSTLRRPTPAPVVLPASAAPAAPLPGLRIEGATPIVPAAFVLPAAAKEAAALPLDASAASADTEQASPQSALAQARVALAQDDERRQAAETAKAARDATFDGSSPRTGLEAVEVRGIGHKSLLDKASYELGRLAAKVLPKRAVAWLTAPPQPQTVFSSDEYGGPQKLDLPLSGRLWYGVKWGFNMVGLTALLDFSATVLEKLLPWQLIAPDSVLGAAGRVELLARAGPKQIAQAMAESPWQFLFYNVPIATVVEEVVYRGLIFGLWLFAFKAVRPAAQKLSNFLGEVAPDDWLSLRENAQILLGWLAKISERAMPLAAAVTAVGFAASHAPAWGVSPHTLFTHLGLGLILAHIAYRTRSLSAPIAAHLVYNLLALTPALLLVHFASPLGALAYLLGVGLFSVTWLYWQWRVHKIARAAALAEARGQAAAKSRATRRVAAALALAGLVASVSVSGPITRGDIHSMAKTRPATAVLFQDSTTAAAPQQPAAEPAKPDTTAKPALPAAVSAEEMIAAVKPAVVRVETGQGLGSGFFVDARGLIFTNAHVVESVGEGGIVRVVFNDALKHPPVKAKVVAFNRGKDIALLRIQEDEHSWPTVALADPRGLREGQRVYAMGHPQGTPFSVSEGIISGLGHRGNLFVRYLQTDAAVNPGNSGGPLFNAFGQVVGMNSWGITRSGGSHGMNFAITSADLALAVKQFVETGNINSAYLGVIVNTSDPLAPEGGIRVEQVRPGSPAAVAGVKKGDILVGVNGHSFGDDPQQALDTFLRGLAGSRPGGTIVLMLERDGEMKPLHLTLGDATKKP